MDIIVVGSGFAGSVIAREVAENTDLTVKIIEKRQHIAGNMYDEYDDHNILVQRYGPHSLFTNNYKVIDYVRRFGEPYQFFVKLLSEIDGSFVRLPFNYLTVQQLVGAEKAESLLAKLRKTYSHRQRVSVFELCESENADISEYGILLFEKAYKTYCSKQWGIPPETIDRAVLDRVMMSMSYDERYIDRDFQYLFKEGFTKLFDNMLKHPNISVELGRDAIPCVELSEETIKFDGKRVAAVAFTGPIDELFGLKYGALPYRSLDIKYEWFNNNDVLPEMVTSHPQAPGYIRKTEYRKFMYDTSKAEGTTIATEYPIEYTGENGQTPYWPVLTEETRSRYAKYKELAGKFSNLFLCGRLAEYRYYNMDDCILSALSTSKMIIEFLKR